MTADKQAFGDALLESLAEVVAWKKGETMLDVVEVDVMPPDRVRAIRHAVAKSTREFERRFGIPAATMNNWEQGRRKPDPAARILLQVIEKSPEMVAAVVAGE